MAILEDIPNSEHSRAVDEMTFLEDDALNTELPTEENTTPDENPTPDVQVDTVFCIDSVKDRISEQLESAMNNAPITLNRSPELVPLTAEWESMKKNLRQLVSLAKNYAETTRAMHRSRSQLVSQFAILSEKSPLFDSVGKNTAGEEYTKELESICENSSTMTRTTLDEIIDSSIDASAYSTHSIYTLQQLMGGHVVFLERDFRTKVIEVAEEWEMAVTEKVEEESKKVRRLQATRIHYEKKINLLRQWANEFEEKGKEVPPAKKEKLARNEAKLKEAFELHEIEAGRLCVLLEEVVVGGWKELHNLIKNYCKWESHQADRSRKIYSKLMPATLKSTKNIHKESNSTKKKKKSKQSPPPAPLPA